ncbi:hypothetical protein BaRGS_00017582 [Batillaria attramentaria]|uniref:Uncharacterized protein n=1 Tax=Batillaria attramentaria TaxID=370345 RepID=A0ABD0KVG1_9CAEN
MEAAKICLLLASPFLLLSLPSTNRHVHAVEIINGDSNDQNDQNDTVVDLPDTDQADPTGNQPNRPSQEMAAVIARNQALDDLFRTAATLEMTMVFVCLGMQNLAEQCASVPDFGTFFADLDMPGLNILRTRRKRFSSWFGTSPNTHTSFTGGSSFNHFNNGFNNFGNSFNNFNSHPSFGGSSFNNFHPGGFSTGFNNAVLCPTASDQSLVYDLGPDSTLYPAEDIGVEIFNGLGTPVVECLMREMVQPTDPPTIIVEPFRLTANATCPFSQLRLWSYQSQAVGGICWVLQNFQENILYRVCSERFCLNCKEKGFGTGLSNFNQKLCITDYMTVSLWAYCPSLPPGLRIIRDRIIIPVRCSCLSVRCDPIPDWKK